GFLALILLRQSGSCVPVPVAVSHRDVIAPPMSMTGPELELGVRRSRGHDPNREHPQRDRGNRSSLRCRRSTLTSARCHHCESLREGQGTNDAPARRKAGTPSCFSTLPTRSWCAWSCRDRCAQPTGGGASPMRGAWYFPGRVCRHIPCRRSAPHAA